MVFQFMRTERGDSGGRYFVVTFLFMDESRGYPRESGGCPRILIWTSTQDAPLVSNQLVDSHLLLDQSFLVLFWINQYTFFDVHL